MLKFIKSFFGSKPTAPATPEAPYKVEAAPAKCGCGRSQSGLCVGLHKLTPEEWASHDDNPNKPTAPKKSKVAAKPKAPAKAKAEKKPAAMKAPKKPRAKKEAK